MKKTLKNLSENSKIGLNVYERQKIQYIQKITKKHKAKLSSSFTCLTMNFALNLKCNILKDFGYSKIFDTIYLIIWFIDMASRLYRR